MNSLSQEVLKEILHYEPDTGIFTWRVRRAQATPAGTVAGCQNQGYRKIKINYFAYFAHRLAWLYMTGSWPKNQIDHINHNRLDNRIINLREATNQENQRNQGLQKNSRSGIMGVNWHKTNRKWCASITVDKKTAHLGSFDSFLDACCARKSAENERNFHPNHGSYTVL